MKIAHMADIHLSELNGPIKDGQNARMMDTIRCMDYAVEKLVEERPDIILIAGDLFHKSKLWGDEMLKEINIAANWLRNLTSIAPVVLMFGTANHDNIKAFKNISDMSISRLTVVTEPDFLTINTQSGNIQIAAVPGMDKGYFRTLFPGMDMTDENKAISEALGNVVLGIAAEADENIPKVLMAHYTVAGCELENGETVFLNNDVVLPIGALQASNYDLVCLGHIHKAQLVENCGRPVYYSGPLNGITFNEEGQEKGLWIHHIDYDMPINQLHQFIKTPAREFLTLNWEEEGIQEFINSGLNEDSWTNLDLIKNKIVRLIYSCSDELNKQFNRKSLEKALYDAGVFYVSEIRPSKILTTTDKNSMSENDSVESNLIETLKRVGYPEEETKEITDIAKPLIAEVAASLPTGKLSGIFEPVSLEVKNYRSYREENFDFSKISFATVNGPNGIGKSSFFMDAIADCLYEEPREGELTGWISNNEDARSGTITFEFLMGDDKWRVIRTRAKSGKTTLALQKWKENHWQDNSDSKKDETQKKIINLLGMDSLTFKSCALIMQDNYGLFLEADKTERMQVLGNILGLSMYDKLHDLVRDKLRIHNREVEKFKNEIEVLDDKLQAKNSTEDMLKNYEVQKVDIINKLSKEELKIKDFQEKINRSNILETKIAAITDKIIDLTNKNHNNAAELLELNNEKDKAKKIIDKEDIILLKIQEYENTSKKIAEIKIKQPILSQKTANLKEITNKIVSLQDQINVKDRAIVNLDIELKNKNILEKEVKELSELEQQLPVMDENKIKKEQLADKVRELRQKVLLLGAEYEKETNQLYSKLYDCTQKVNLIKNSNCPVDNPSCNFLKDALEAKSKLPEIKKQLDEFDRSEIEKVDKELHEAELTLDNFNYNFELHQEIKNKIEALRKKKEQLLSLFGKDELLKNHLQQKDDLLINLKDLQEKVKKINLEIDVLDKELKPLSELEKALPALEHWYKGKDEVPRAKQTFESVNKRIEILKNDVKKVDSAMQSLEAERDKLAAERSELNGNKELLEEAKRKILVYQQNRSDIDIFIGSYRSKLQELEKYEDDKKEKSDKLAELAKITAQLAVLVQAFSIDGIPFQIVRSVVSELSAKSNEILSQMTGGKMSIEFKMDKVLKNKKEVNALEIWINDYQRGNMPYLSRSGGQKVKAALSVAFALADLKANRAGIQLGMMFIDEPPFLDGEGTQAYADALELMHNQYGDMKVIAISHDPTMKARFPQSIDVMDSGEAGSKIIFNE